MTVSPGLSIPPPTTSRRLTPSDALADTGSGPRSVSFPAISQTGFAGNSVNDTASPFESGTYSFDATNLMPPADAAVVGEDNAGNAATATITFVRDTTAPSGGGISYPDGEDADGVITIATTDGVDAEAGLAPGSGVLERQTASLPDSTCGTFGAWVMVA